MIDEQVDERIRLSLGDRLSEQRSATETDPVGAVRARVSRRRRRRRGAMAAGAALAAGTMAVLAVVVVPRDAGQDLETANENSSAAHIEPVLPEDFRIAAEEPTQGLDEESLDADDDLPIRVDASPTLDSLLEAVVDNRGAFTVTDRYEWQFRDGTKSLFVDLEDPSGVLVKVALLNTSNENVIPDELTKRYPDGASDFAELSIRTFAPPSVDPTQFRSHDSLNHLFAAVDAWALER